MFFLLGPVVVLVCYLSLVLGRTASPYSPDSVRPSAHSARLSGLAFFAVSLASGARPSSLSSDRARAGLGSAVPLPAFDPVEPRQPGPQAEAVRSYYIARAASSSNPIFALTRSTRASTARSNPSRHPPPSIFRSAAFSSPRRFVRRLGNRKCLSCSLPCLISSARAHRSCLRAAVPPRSRSKPIAKPWPAARFRDKSGESAARPLAPACCHPSDRAPTAQILSPNQTSPYRSTAAAPS